jgi:diacylglycerol kinase family enzyme
MDLPTPVLRKPGHAAIVVLVNPAAGAGGPANADTIAARFLAAGVHAEIVLLRPGQDPADAAREASARASIVVAAGGDGTVSRVAAGLAGTNTVFGVLAMGTRNHFAKDLRIPLDLDEAIATIAGRHVSRIDVGRVNDRVFVNNCSIGVYSNIVEAREQLRREGYGKWPAFLSATWRVLRHYRGVLVRISALGRQSVWRTPFVFVGNNAYQLEGRHLGGRAALDGGRLVAYLAPRVRTRDLPLLVVRALLGLVRHSGEFEVVSTTDLCVDTPYARRIRVAVDGEVATMTTPLHYQISTGALHVLSPPAQA